MFLGPMMMMMMMIWIRDDVDIDWPTDDDMFFQQRFWVLLLLLLLRLEVVVVVFFSVFFFPNRPSVARSGCDERRLPTPPSFLEHHKTLNSKKDIQICLRISPIYLPSPLSPPRAHKRHRSTIVTFFAISSHHHGSRRRQPRAQDLASVFRFGCIQ